MNLRSLSLPVAGLGLALLAATATAVSYGRLPPELAIHWNLQGQPDLFAPKAWAAWFGPGLIAGLTGLATAMSILSPGRIAIAPFAGTFRIIMIAILTLLTGIVLLVLANGMGVQLPVVRIILGIVGVVLAFAGNYLGKTTPNLMMGVRNVWTLADPEIWLKANRVASRLFVLAGLTLLLTTFLDASPFVSATVLIGAVAVCVIVPTIYSWRLARARDRSGK